VKIRFQGDYDLKRVIIIGLKRKVPAISFRNADESGLRGLNDEEVLAIAKTEDMRARGPRTQDRLSPLPSPPSLPFRLRVFA